MSESKNAPGSKNLSGPKLVTPHKRWAASFAEALEEGLHSEPADPEDIALARIDFDAYDQRRHDLTRPVILPDGSSIQRLPQIDLWLMQGDHFLGMASLRPRLNDTLRRRGGNIGYAVRASERRKGYGHHILSQALPHLKEAGLRQALITCHDQNIGSIRIIEGAGGILEDTVVIPGLDIPERRYWIQL